MAKSEKIKTLEKQIAEGLKPPCPECGSRLDIEELKGNTGSKGYSYACLKKGDNEHCPLPAGMAYVPPHFVIWQAMQQKIVQIALIAIASVALVGTGGNILGVFDFKVGGEKSDAAAAQIADKDSSGKDTPGKDDTIAVLRGEVDKLTKKLEETATPSVTNKTAEEEILIWEAELRRGIDRYEKRPREFNKSKQYLFTVLEKYNQNEGRYSLEPDQRSRIMEILADLVIKINFDPAELETFIDYADKQKYSPAGRRSHHLGIAYYHLSQEDRTRELDKSLSFLNYLRFLSVLIPRNSEAAYEPATQKAIDEILPAMKDCFRLMDRNDQLAPDWNARTIKKIEKAVEKKDSRSITTNLRQMEEHMEQLGWGI